jgi:hypothetical protein
MKIAVTKNSKRFQRSREKPDGARLPKGTVNPFLSLPAQAVFREAVTVAPVKAQRYPAVGRVPVEALCREARVK